MSRLLPMPQPNILVKVVRPVLVAFFCLQVQSVLAAESEGHTPVSRWSGASESGIYAVEIFPESGKITVGKMHRWIIRVADDQGQPVYPAKISIGGGMESHGHGLPTQPQAVAYGGNGEYLVDGMRFNMAGMWRLSFVIESEHGVDRADFDIKVKF